jgi:hypothetical protein
VPVIGLIDRASGILRSQWQATNAAAAKLDARLSCSLLHIVGEAIAELQQRPFAERIIAEQETMCRSMEAC